MYPVLFRLGEFELRSYGVMLALAFLVGIWHFAREIRRAGINEDFIYELGIYLILGALVGGRLSYVLSEWGYYGAHPGAIWRVWEGGLAFYGGLVLDLSLAFFFLKRRGLPVGKIMDLAAPALALGYALARVGCFLNGCCYGHLTALPWGVDFGDGPRHPTQLYAAGASLLIFFALRGWKKNKPFEGYLIWLYLGLYALYRFLVEFFREAPQVTPWLTLGQLASALLGIVVLLVLWLYPRRIKLAASSKK